MLGPRPPDQKVAHTLTRHDQDSLSQSRAGRRLSLSQCPRPLLEAKKCTEEKGQFDWRNINSTSILNYSLVQINSCTARTPQNRTGPSIIYSPVLRVRSGQHRRAEQEAEARVLLALLIERTALLDWTDSPERVCNWNLISDVSEFKVW